MGNPLPRHERVPLNIHFMMGALCLFFSTAFHILECHSPSIHELFCRLDHFGIAGLIWGAKLAWIKSSSINRDPNFDATLILGANIVCVISGLLGSFRRRPSSSSFPWQNSSTTTDSSLP